MTADRTLPQAQPAPASLLSRLKVPAILLLVAANVIWFGGNAVIDLWQVLGPPHHFTGTIVGHDRVVTETENSEQFLVLTIDPNALKVDVPEHTFADTSVGQRVSGELDARGLFGHDEALRSLKADGKQVFSANTLNRVLGQLFIFGVVVTIGAITFRWLLGRRRARAV
jgi:hypothetical protein